MEPFDILVEQSYLLLNIGTLGVDLFGIIHLFMFFLQTCDPFIAVLDLLLVETRSTSAMITVEGNPHLSFFESFINLWKASARLGEVGKLALQILYNAGSGSSSIPHLIVILWRTHISFIFDVRPHELVLESFDLLLQFDRLFDFLEPIFCG